MNGNAVLYDAVNGKILTVGGAPDHQSNATTSNARSISIGTLGTTASIAAIGFMANARAFHNSVVILDGKVLVVGGESYPVPFSNDTSTLVQNSLILRPPVSLL